MIVLKTLEPEEVLLTILSVINKIIPDEARQNSKARIMASFNDDNSVELCLITEDIIPEHIN